MKWLPLLLLAGCVWLERDCTSMGASSFGSDWLIVQLRADGEIARCWHLEGVGVTNEAHSDGIFWQDPAGHLVHISGWYNRVQVNTLTKSRKEAFLDAARGLGVDLNRCTNGAYQEETDE